MKTHSPDVASLTEIILRPFHAALAAQEQLIDAQAAFLATLGSSGGRSVSFAFDRPAPGATPGADGIVPTETVKLDVPLLSIVNVPTLAITSVGCTIMIDGDTASIRDVSIGSSDVRNAAGFAALA